MEKRSIYICDDHQLFLQSLEIFINLRNDFTCIGHADEFEKAASDITILKPDIVLVDYHMKDVNGLELLEKFMGIYPDADYFMITMRRDAGIRNQVAALGGKGYLLKTVGAEEMLRVFDQIHTSKITFYDSLSKFIPEASGQNKKRLSERELEIAHMVCREYSSEQIATELNLSLHTVNTHRKNILRKIDAKNAIDLMNYLNSLGT
jgi:two-component system nitrate/nitrite response regulator NarL